MRPRLSKAYSLPLSKTQAARLRRRWRRWLGLIESELARQVSWRKMYEDYWDIVEANPPLLKHGDFHDWLSRSYMASAFLGLRRLTDQDHRSLSLRRFLSELQDLPSAMTREAHHSRYPRDRRWLADLSFDNLSRSSASILSSRAIKADLRKLDSVDRRFRRFINKRIAHIGSPGAIRKTPSLKDLDAALKTVEEVTLRYHGILFAEALHSVAPTNLYEWWEVFYEPWIPPGHPWRPEEPAP